MKSRRPHHTKPHSECLIGTRGDCHSLFPTGFFPFAVLRQGLAKLSSWVLNLSVAQADTEAGNPPASVNEELAHQAHLWLLNDCVLGAGGFDPAEGSLGTDPWEPTVTHLSEANTWFECCVSRGSSARSLDLSSALLNS